MAGAAAAGWRVTNTVCVAEGPPAGGPFPFILSGVAADRVASA